MIMKSKVTVIDYTLVGGTIDMMLNGEVGPCFENVNYLKTLKMYMQKHSFITLKDYEMTNKMPLSMFEENKVVSMTLPEDSYKNFWIIRGYVAGNFSEHFSSEEILALDKKYTKNWSTFLYQDVENRKIELLEKKRIIQRKKKKLVKMLLK